VFKRAKKYLGFDDRWLILTGIPVITVVITTLIFGTEMFKNELIPCLSIAAIFTIAYWLTFRELIIQYHKRFSDYTFNKKRLLYVISRFSFAYIGVKFGVGYIINYFHPEHVSFYDNNKLGYLNSEISELMMIALVFFIYEGIYYFNKSRLIEIEKNKLEKITAEQRLDTLKNQVNPHFLFNSLNTVVTMIPEEPELAITFIQKLSKTYRNILEFRNEKLITIKQELSALDSYIYLLKTRFQGKIHIYNSIHEKHLQQFILPISLQILIENAVKHNITSKAKPLKIELSSNETHIIVKNNLQRKTQKYNSTKLGLANISSRYKLLAHKEIEVIEDDHFFCVKLPIIKNILHENTDH